LSGRCGAPEELQVVEEDLGDGGERTPIEQDLKLRRSSQVLLGSLGS